MMITRLSVKWRNGSVYELQVTRRMPTGPSWWPFQTWNEIKYVVRNWGKMQKYREWYLAIFKRDLFDYRNHS
jgi:hypothetical protein